MKFYEFSQNNSGGSFVTTDKLCHRLFIEADSDVDACEIAQSFGVYFNGCEQEIDCDCCGDRWSAPYNSIEFPYKYTDKLIFNDITQYTQYLANEYIAWTSPDSRVFLKDGSVIEISKTKNDV